MRRTQKPHRQLTLDKLPTSQPSPAQPPQLKQIKITQFASETGIDELTLKVSFALKPSKAAFSKLKADLRFEEEVLSSVLIRVPQGPLSTDELEYSWVLDMTGIGEGKYAVGVEMYEAGGSEKLNCATDELTLDYVPQTRRSCYIRVPSVKSVAGADLSVASKTESELYRELENTLREEQKCRRDNW
ncbi:MAG: hypothetical protein NWE93_13300 [Candidatus Bathyarchaeota archaeon]|nr:hypothetical protein [Candidatus Bathyarchaeota archaeon]